MLCKRCELIMTQAAEDDFLLRFPHNADIQEFKYKSWLFNYCCAIIFRTMTLVKFPRTFNDDELYKTFLYCRKHLLPLPVKVDGGQVKLTENESYWIKQYSKWTFEEFEPYLLLIPPTALSDGLVTTTWVSPHRLVDGINDYSGMSHFFIAICNNLGILLKFKPSGSCPLPEECKINPNGGTYKIENEHQQLGKIPKGFWTVCDRFTSKTNASLAEVLKHISPGMSEKLTAQLVCPILPKMENIFCDTKITNAPSNKFVLSLLPSNIQIVSFIGTGDTVMQKKVRLPQGHEIILHQTIGEGDACTCFIVMDLSKPGLSDTPYALFVRNTASIFYLDGAFISDVNGKVCFTKFFLDHALCHFYRRYYHNLYVFMAEFVLNTLLKDGFASLKHFLHHWRTRQSISGADNIISLGNKCSAGSCWYCYDLCHCCMSQAFPLSDKSNVITPFRFCSEKCKSMFCGDPDKFKLSTFAIHHTDEIGKVIGMSVLDIVKISRLKGDAYNTIEIISLCLGDGSEGLPQSEPYILWQVRKVDGQLFLNFHTTETCIPLESLWISSIINDDFLAAQTEKALASEPYLNSTLTAAVHSLHFDNLISYLAPFKSAISCNPCIISGNGITSSGLQRGNDVQVVVQTLSEGMKRKPYIFFHVIDPDGLPCLVQSTEADGVITFKYQLLKVGKYNVFVYCNGRKTPDSPFLVSVTNVSLIQLSPLPSNIKVNIPTLFTIKAEGAGEGQPSCIVEQSETNRESDFVVAKTKVMAREENVFEIEVVVLVTGQLLLKFMFDEIVIPNGYFKIDVDSD